MSDCIVLVVDDDETIRAALSETLDMEGYPVRLAADGAEALRSVEENPPKVVLLDMRMPVLDGWGFARGLAERGLRPAILVMSAAADARRWAREIGASGVLPKPFELDELLALVERYCASTGGCG
jgi:two-component system, chemotaxis family, chemotaxis protein CheY